MPPYIKRVEVSGGPCRLQCLLCGTESPSSLNHETLKKHLETPQHQASLQGLGQDLRRVAVQSHRYCRLVSQPLSSELANMDQMPNTTSKAAAVSSKDAIHADLYRLLVVDTIPDQTSDNADGNEKKKRNGNVDHDRPVFDTAIEPVLKKIKTMEVSECLFPLSLAVWKGQCIVNMPKGGDYLFSLEWARAGWKTRKDKLRAASLSRNAIVAAAIWPFLIDSRPMPKTLPLPPLEPIVPGGPAVFASTKVAADYQSPIPLASESERELWLQPMNTSLEGLASVLDKRFNLPVEEGMSARKVPYLQSSWDCNTYPYDCLLCLSDNKKDAFELDREGVKAHFKSASHKAKRQALRKDLHRLAKQTRRYCRLVSSPLRDELLAKIHALPDWSTRNAIHADLYRTLVAIPERVYDCYDTCVEEDYYEFDDEGVDRDQPIFDKALEPVQSKLYAMQLNEQLSLLAMAVWKAQCVVRMQTTTGNFAAVEGKGVVQPLEWSTYKDKLQSCSAMGIVVAAVCPFLKQPKAAKPSLVDKAFVKRKRWLVS